MLEGMKPTKRKSYVCKVATSIEELDATDGKILAAAISDDKTWPAATLATELRKRKLSLSDMTILRHRKQTCVCYREIG
jgi:hypothetical protein|tara:strand:- start:802 stop:1038 length:237 start_codon:yes stop_codon:yes gene_type:complete